MMLTLSLAQQLQIAGLIWTPADHDYFAIPNREFEDQVFVINDMAIIVEYIRGRLAVTFHGTPEWALDYILVAELVWLPTEAQLRQLLEQYLIGEPEPKICLTSQAEGYHCQIRFQNQRLSFEAFGASEAYGLALLHILETLPASEAGLPG